MSAQSDLIANPLTRGTPTSIVIKILATVPVGGSCNEFEVRLVDPEDILTLVTLTTPGTACNQPRIDRASTVAPSGQGVGLVMLAYSDSRDCNA